LKNKDPNLYAANGLLNMLDRNAKVKEAPERWQEYRMHFDIIITFEERVFDLVVEDVLSRDSQVCAPCYIFNLHTKDNHEEAAVGSVHAWQLVQMLSENEEWEDNLDSLLDEFQQLTGKIILYNLLFY